MIKTINSKQLLKEGIGKYLPRTQVQLDSIKEQVLSFVNDVKENGDSALIKYTQNFDKITLTHDTIRVSESEIDRAYELMPDKLVTAIKEASKNIKKFHQAQIREPWTIETRTGVKTGQVLRPIDSVGMYVPGGRAVYPSTVLMTAIPAKVAGVEKLVVCSPPGKFEFDGVEYFGIHPSILIAARETGVDDVFKIGSAWAIAAMAFGTESVPSVSKIIGPGNKYVNAAKLLVRDFVSIDNPAGPSEVAIIADGNANPEYVAYDLLSQVEHDPDNVGVVITDSESLIKEIITETEKAIELAPRKDIMRQSLEKFGLMIKTENLDESIEIANLVATEHLEILTENPRSILPKIKHAGAIFLGQYSPVPLGDYAAGTNHVLPTGGTANRFSGLNTMDFMKIIDVLECEQSGLEELEKILTPIAEFEGLFGHRDAVKIRLKKN